jgi:hypothetical protein
MTAISADEIVERAMAMLDRIQSSVAGKQAVGS